MLLGFIHSDTTYAIIKAGGLSKFNRYWYDPMTGNTAEYSPDTVDDFYQLGKQKWSLMLENLDEDCSNMPKFATEDTGYIIHAYDWQIL